MSSIRISIWLKTRRTLFVNNNNLLQISMSSIELFANVGKEVFTLLTYPGETQVGIETFAKNEGTKMNFKAWKLKSIWK
jgi:sucrose-6-phosphate hydrolase SacC (GH32 family)